ncbi:hypothetical protein [Bacillus sp. JJ722]|uniref:hypothetical protein n=1 Tax=Bacillus sp. JJ722 TaxID=3122973 RepID=UPI002FFF0705
MNYIAWLIVGCEIGFWIAILLGLISRYIFKKKKLGLFFLALTPIIDIVLLITTSIDLINGATASTIHGIAAIYIGTSIAYGKSMIAWADHRFQYYVLKQGTKPQKKYGMEHAKHNLRSALKHVLAYIIGATFLLAIIFIIDDPTRTNALANLLKFWSLVLVIDFVSSLSYFIWPRREKGSVISK